MSSHAQEIAKRMLDVIVSGAAMILLCPLLALIALSIRASMGHSVLFRQTRAGYRASPFTVLKFRTMSEACDSEGNLLPDPDRLTPLGAFCAAGVSMSSLSCGMCSRRDEPGGSAALIDGISGKIHTGTG